MKKQKGALNSIIVMAVALASAGIYFYGIPAWQEHRSEREKTRLKLEQEVAEEEIVLAMQKEQAKLNDLCFSSDVKQLSATDSITDGGTQPHAEVKVRIAAADGHFIFGPTIKYSKSGTNYFRSNQLTKYGRPETKGTPYEKLIVGSAVYEVWCDAPRDLSGNRSCRATATIYGQQLPNACIKAILQEQLTDIQNRLSEQN